jgi:hypothetical protein
MLRISLFSGKLCKCLGLSIIVEHDKAVSGKRLLQDLEDLDVEAVSTIDKCDPGSNERAEPQKPGRQHI